MVVCWLKCPNSFSCTVESKLDELRKVRSPETVEGDMHMNWLCSDAVIVRHMISSLLVIASLGSGLAYGDPPMFSNSYVVTTRAQPGADPVSSEALSLLPEGKLFFCSAPGHYVQSDEDYTLANGTPCTTDPLDEADSGATPPTSFLQALEQDVRKTTNGTKTAHLSLYVHGLGLTFPTAVTEGAQFGLHFQGKNIDNDEMGTTVCIPIEGKLPKDCILCPQDARKGIYPGLVIAFDWPSFPLTGPPTEELFLLEVLLAPMTGREIRVRADESAEALVNVFEHVVQALRQQLRKDGIKLVTTLIAHSEGNYLLMKGAQSAVARRMKNVFDNVLLLAADISSAALNKGGPGRDLRIIGKRVTAYNSSSDPALLVSSYLWSSLHDPSFQARLGQTGPYSKLNKVIGVDATQATNRVQPDIGNLSVSDFDDCAVPNPVTSLQSPVLAGLLAVHGSYRCVAEILDDMDMTMLRGVEKVSGADRRIKLPGIKRHFSLQTDNNPPLFSCEQWMKAGFGNSSP